ncbi:MAG: hypothetical protein RLZ37_2165 [Actinomycetota bacterium]|jgi:hypothetical protein
MLHNLVACLVSLSTAKIPAALPVSGNHLLGE